MKKLVKKILSILYNPILSHLDSIKDLLSDQNNVLTNKLDYQNKILQDQNNILQRQNDLNTFIVKNTKLKQLQQNDYVHTSYLNRDNQQQFEMKFYCPNYNKEYMETHIVDDGIWDLWELEEFDNYITDNSIILDIGANKGTHSVYWGIVRKAKKIISFEPIKSTFDILSKNIELNKLQDVIIPYNIGLGAHKSQGVINFIRPSNALTTSIKEDISGDLTIEALDNIDLQVDRIDFIKIDTEGYELEVLKGAIQTIKKYTPTLSIEIFTEGIKEMILTDKNRAPSILGNNPEFLTQKFDTIVDILMELGYKLEKDMGIDFIFVHKDKINK